MKSIPPVPPPKPKPVNPVQELRGLLGDVVFLKCVGKQPVAKGWQKTTLADMTADYLAKLNGGNIGVLLGEPSGGLCVIDLDQDEFVEPFLAANPALASTLQTFGSRGRAIWVRFEGNYPQKSSRLKTPDGEGVGEFRANGNQSIVSGIHPATGKPYQIVVKVPVASLKYDQIVWLDGIICPIGHSPIGPVLKGPVPISVVGLPESGSASGVIDGSALDGQMKAAIDKAVEVGAGLPVGNNSASFHACLALLNLLDREDLSGLSRHERNYFSDCWYLRLSASRRTTKTKSHYSNDILISIKNAKRNAKMKSKNRAPQAWALAQTSPLPPEAGRFDDEPKFQRLIALCYQMHILHDKGPFPLAYGTVAKVMGLSENERRRWLMVCFNVMVGSGFLEVVTPHDKEGHRATTYRYVAQGAT
jgi:hypothetical protein